MSIFVGVTGRREAGRGENRPEPQPSEKPVWWGAPFFVIVAASLALVGTIATSSAEDLAVEPRTVTDWKTVFGTVQAAERVPARARLSGTLTELGIDEGSTVTKGDVIARIVDEKLALQRRALDAQIAAAQSQLDNLQTEYDRAQRLFAGGTISKARIDQLETQRTVAQNSLAGAEAERAVLDQQVAEGEVAAPASGRVLSVPVTAGSVVMAGEAVATVAIDGYVLRVEIPERHARQLSEGQPVQVGSGVLTAPDRADIREGKIIKIYPEVKQGRVIADAEVAGLGDFFVGERIQVRIVAGTRQAFVIPRSFVITRNGLDVVRLQRVEGEPVEVLVQLGGDTDSEGGPNVEILSGLVSGDRLVQP